MTRYPFIHRLRESVRGNRPVDPATARQALYALEDLADFIERLERRAANEQPDLCQILEETGLVPTEEIRRVRAEQEQEPRVIEASLRLEGEPGSQGAK